MTKKVILIIIGIILLVVVIAGVSVAIATSTNTVDIITPSECYVSVSVYEKESNPGTLITEDENNIILGDDENDPITEFTNISKIKITNVLPEKEDVYYTKTLHSDAISTEDNLGDISSVTLYLDNNQDIIITENTECFSTLKKNDTIYIIISEYRSYYYSEDGYYNISVFEVIENDTIDLYSDSIETGGPLKIPKSNFDENYKDIVRLQFSLEKPPEDVDNVIEAKITYKHENDNIYRIYTEFNDIDTHPIIIDVTEIEIVNDNTTLSSSLKKLSTETETNTEILYIIPQTTNNYTYTSSISDSVNETYTLPIFSSVALDNDGNVQYYNTINQTWSGTISSSSSPTKFALHSTELDKGGPLEIKYSDMDGVNIHSDKDIYEVYESLEYANEVVFSQNFFYRITNSKDDLGIELFTYDSTNTKQQYLIYQLPIELTSNNNSINVMFDKDMGDGSDYVLESITYNFYSNTEIDDNNIIINIFTDRTNKNGYGLVENVNYDNLLIEKSLTISNIDYDGFIHGIDFRLDDINTSYDIESIEITYKYKNYASNNIIINSDTLRSIPAFSFDFTVEIFGESEIIDIKTHDEANSVYIKTDAFPNIDHDYRMHMLVKYEELGCNDNEVDDGGNKKACNYNSYATENDGSCLYTVDCNNQCGGHAYYSEDCKDTDGSPSCIGGYTGEDCLEDCNGVWGGSAIEDGECPGTCIDGNTGRTSSSVKDCKGECMVVDNYGVYTSNNEYNYCGECVPSGTSLACPDACSNPSACNYYAPSTAPASTWPSHCIYEEDGKDCDGNCSPGNVVDCSGGECIPSTTPSGDCMGICTNNIFDDGNNNIYYSPGNSCPSNNCPSNNNINESSITLQKDDVMVFRTDYEVIPTLIEVYLGTDIGANFNGINVFTWDGSDWVEYDEFVNVFATSNKITFENVENEKTDSFLIQNNSEDDIIIEAVKLEYKLSEEDENTSTVYLTNTAQEDDCEDCSGGTSGYIANSNKDCMGECNGSAEMNSSCNFCYGGTSPIANNDNCEQGCDGEFNNMNLIVKLCPDNSGSYGGDLVKENCTTTAKLPYTFSKTIKNYIFIIWLDNNNNWKYIYPTKITIYCDNIPNGYTLKTCKYWSTDDEGWGKTASYSIDNNTIIIDPPTNNSGTNLSARGIHLEAPADDAEIIIKNIKIEYEDEYGYSTTTYLKTMEEDDCNVCNGISYFYSNNGTGPSCNSEEEENNCTMVDRKTCDCYGKTLDSCGVCGGENVCIGCTVVNASNYSSSHTQDTTPSECRYECHDDDDAGWECNPSGSNTCDYCGVCGGNNDCVGCTDYNATNYNSSATYDDGSSCTYPSCTGSNEGTVCNSSEETCDRCGICGEDGTSCGGCMDDNATNYDSSVTYDDGSCTYPSCTGSNEGTVCDGAGQTCDTENGCCDGVFQDWSGFNVSNSYDPYNGYYDSALTCDTSTDSCVATDNIPVNGGKDCAGVCNGTAVYAQHPTNETDKFGVEHTGHKPFSWECCESGYVRQTRLDANSHELNYSCCIPLSNNIDETWMLSYQGHTSPKYNLFHSGPNGGVRNLIKFQQDNGTYVHMLEIYEVIPSISLVGTDYILDSIKINNAVMYQTDTRKENSENSYDTFTYQYKDGSSSWYQSYKTGYTPTITNGQEETFYGGVGQTSDACSDYGPYYLNIQLPQNGEYVELVDVDYLVANKNGDFDYYTGGDDGNAIGTYITALENIDSNVIIKVYCWEDVITLFLKSFFWVGGSDGEGANFGLDYQAGGTNCFHFDTNKGYTGGWGPTLSYINKHDFYSTSSTDYQTLGNLK